MSDYVLMSQLETTGTRMDTRQLTFVTPEERPQLEVRAHSIGRYMSLFGINEVSVQPSEASIGRVPGFRYIAQTITEDEAFDVGSAKVTIEVDETRVLSGLARKGNEQNLEAKADLMNQIVCRGLMLACDDLHGGLKRSAITGAVYGGIPLLASELVGVDRGFATLACFGLAAWGYEPLVNRITGKPRAGKLRGFSAGIRPVHLIGGLLSLPLDARLDPLFRTVEDYEEPDSPGGDDNPRWRFRRKPVFEPLPA